MQSQTNISLVHHWITQKGKNETDLHVTSLGHSLDAFHFFSKPFGKQSN